MSVPKCKECSCEGNQSCGAEIVFKDCSLDECLICSCCRILGKEKNMERWKK